MRVLEHDKIERRLQRTLQFTRLSFGGHYRHGVRACREPQDGVGKQSLKFLSYRVVENVSFHLTPHTYRSEAGKGFKYTLIHRKP